MFPSLTRDEVFRIETRRLWLRWPRLEDAIALAAWIGPSDAAGMAASITAQIEAMRALNASGTGLAFVLVPQGADSQPIGLTSVSPADGRLELGYELAPAWWGRGLMSEAVGALCEQVFELNSASSIGASVQPDNFASVGVLESCGFRMTGTVQRDNRTVTHYALARSRPSALRAAQRRFYADPKMEHDFVGFV